MTGAGTIRLLASLLICGSLVAGVFPCAAGEAVFSGTEAVLERAITADDPEAVAAALAGGASVNGRGAHEVTPLEFAIGFMHKRAAAQLIRHQADPNLKDAAGDSAVTLAVDGYTRDPELLRMVLDAGGDPNTVRPDGNPVMYRFLTRSDLDAIAWLHARGASIDAMVNGEPMVVAMALSLDWDVVWHLIALGARLDTPRVTNGLVGAFYNPQIPVPGSQKYQDKVKVWRRLKELGLNPTPPAGM